MRWHASTHALPLAALVAVATASLPSCAESAPGEDARLRDRRAAHPDLARGGGRCVHRRWLRPRRRRWPASRRARRDHPDWAAPDGRLGIDNQLAGGGLAQVVRLLAEQEEDSTALFEGLVQGAVTAGTLLVLLRFDDVNSFENDDDVTMTVLLGEPFAVGVGTDGRLLAGQSFDIRPRHRARGGGDTYPRWGAPRGGASNSGSRAPSWMWSSISPLRSDRCGSSSTPTARSPVCWAARSPNTIADVIPRIGGASQYADLGRRVLGGHGGHHESRDRAVRLAVRFHPYARSARFHPRRGPVRGGRCWHPLR